MTLTLVIPGLIWPRQVMRDTLYDTDFPALQTLLGKGRSLPSASLTTDAWWCSYFGVSRGDFSAAPLRLAAIGEASDNSSWLCADPVHLCIDQKGATLTDPALMNISAAEARELHALLAPLLVSVGKLVISTPSNWHIKLANSEQPLSVLPKNLSDLIGQSAVSLLPAGDANRPWRQMINELQMALHSHPLNAARSAQGKTIINSIALWGEGRAPTLQKKTTSQLLSDNLIVSGAGMLAGMTTAKLPPRFTNEVISAMSNITDCIVDWDYLRFPAATHDALAWREKLEQLEALWLAPALAALAHGQLKKIELHGFGDERAVSSVMTNLDRYCFWRKPRRLETL
jgi:hypothetical protein